MMRTLRAHAPCAPRAVRVVRRAAGQFQIEHQVNGRQVQAAGRHVVDHQRAVAARAEVAHDAGALQLSHVTVQCRNLRLARAFRCLVISVYGDSWTGQGAAAVQHNVGSFCVRPNAQGRRRCLVAGTVAGIEEYRAAQLRNAVKRLLSDPPSVEQCTDAARWSRQYVQSAFKFSFTAMP